MSKTILHIGGAKCASTYLQRKVLCNTKKYDFYGPKSSVSSLFLDYCLEETNIYPKFDCSESIILSHEGLSIYENLKGGYVADRMGSVVGKAEVIYVIREQKSWLVSRYYQDLENYMGLYTDYYTFKEWLNGDFHDGLSMHSKNAEAFLPLERIKYDNIIDKLRDNFGEVHVIPMEVLKINNKNFLKSISKILDVKVEPEDREVSNRRIGVYEEKMEKSLGFLMSNRKIARVVKELVKISSELFPYKKGVKKIDNNVVNIIRSTNRKLIQMDVNLTKEYIS
ncbi:hypothetical protein [Salinibacter ruber]|uniref:hypothetical protein n=1 Tax=Salinibacter ruber TaxID=146919 RepID=UPI002167E432|nr:hypothetical protein [Salinibacter ruber]MCS4174790.1 hypothetical protein [Salinibacter ruber]